MPIALSFAGIDTTFKAFGPGQLPNRLFRPGIWRRGGSGRTIRCTFKEYHHVADMVLIGRPRHLTDNESDAGHFVDRLQNKMVRAVDRICSQSYKTCISTMNQRGIRFST